jgi:hypothetical protein
MPGSVVHLAQGGLGPSTDLNAPMVLSKVDQLGEAHIDWEVVTLVLYLFFCSEMLKLRAHNLMKLSDGS